ncbi:MAG: Asp-tRNA(Asn)/Glu-tRNA(Gln) amidotransferase GatCAB subunit C [Planctomycetes bacterium]|nr:Asp-tRNA(Asn)/Glu-tRNA(Gln) amidotransferase GatCAB subunit C [Planctomycetota bacterium]
MDKPQPTEIKVLAELARLRLEDQTAARIAGQLERILDWFRSLDAIDTAGVEPSPYAVVLRNVTRPDEPATATDDLPHGQDILNCGPEQTKDCYLVPPVLGS